MRFANDWTPQDVADGARLVLQLELEAAAQPPCIDALCRWWHQQPWRTAYLTASAPFLENISMLENFWLPLAWRRATPLAQVLSRATRHLPALGWNQQDLQRLLACRPGDLPPQVLARAVLLRAALLDPAWVLIEASWFERSLLPPAQRFELTEQLLGASRWLLVGLQPEMPLPAPVAWHTIALEAVG